ncbi:uncharacterized protein, partial [Amphiura filiformis]|uniref:uncharacterized protein n=1 Tax=Amphiura filiformis TaxID=82378 RepID=UPI003B212A0E
MATVQSRRVNLTEEENTIVSSISANEFITYVNYQEEQRAEMLKAVNHSKNEDSKSVTVYYDNEAAEDWYQKYEHLDILYIIGVRIIAEVMESQVQVKQARILDVAAGTGLTGIEVTKLGFENIDALEPSEEMLKKLPRNVYKNIYKEALDPVKQSNIPNNSYDCLVSTGSVLEGHIEGAHFSEFVRILKP